MEACLTPVTAAGLSFRRPGNNGRPAIAAAYTKPPDRELSVAYATATQAGVGRGPSLRSIPSTLRRAVSARRRFSS